MCSKTNEIDLILFSVIEYFSISLALADSVLDVAPKMRFRRNRFLQTMRCLVIGSFPPQWIPGDLRFVQSEGWQYMQQMQLRLVLLRKRQSIVERQLRVV